MSNQRSLNDKQSAVPGDSDSVPKEAHTALEILRIFISHPEKFRQIADVLRKAIQSWSGGEIQVFQSSEAYSAEGPVVGGPLREEIKQELDASDVILVIYVTADEAGSCMFEAGIAYGSTKKKRVIVFQCGDEMPWAFKADRFVTISNHDIDRFTRDFHLSSQFFPNRKKKLFPHIPPDILKDRSVQLYEDLRATRPPSLYAPQEIDRWISITVSLADDLTKKINETAKEELAADNQPTTLKKTKVNETAKEELATDNQPTILKKTKVEARKLIKEHSIITDSTHTAPQHFGMNDFRGKNTKLYDIYMRWRQMMRVKGEDRYLNYDWWSEVCDQMTLAVSNWRAQQVEIPLKSAHEEKTWYFPVLTSAIELPLQKKWDFIFHFVRIPEDGQFIKIQTLNPISQTKQTQTQT